MTGVAMTGVAMFANVAAACGTAMAVWVARPDDWLVLRVRLSPDGVVPVELPRLRLLALPIGGLAIAAIPSWAAQFAASAVVGAVAFGVALRSRAVRRARARQFRAATASYLRSWSAELRSGLAAVDAAHAAAGDDAVWRPIRLATAADVPDALRAIASEPGGEALVDAAAAWAIAESTGAPLAVVLERVSGAVQAAVDVDLEVAVEASPARATARLMAFLPVIGIVLGTTLGADPLGILFGTGLGVGCLILGLVLAGVGVWWIERLVAAVDP
jgi:tight adherence protein B